MQVRATARYARAVHAIADLLGRLKIEVVFVGAVARSAWLGGEVARGSVDLIALMQSQQVDQLARMASNRGFRVEQEEIDQTVELDLVPLNFVDEEGDVRVHVLVATNALYGRMAAAAVEATLHDSIIGDRTLRVVTAEDLGLLTMMSDDDVTLRALTMLDAFDRRGFNQKLISIGLAERVIAE